PLRDRFRGSPRDRSRSPDRSPDHAPPGKNLSPDTRMVQMKRNLIIEWKHIGTTVTGTCERCSLTGGAIMDVLEDLQPYFRQKNITARFRETILPDSQIEESNQVLINGVPLEEYLSD